MLTAQAVCCALLYSANSHGDEDTIDDCISQVQSHLQTLGQTDMAQNIAYSLKLAKHIHKASCYKSAELHSCAVDLPRLLLARQDVQSKLAVHTML